MSFIDEIQDHPEFKSIERQLRRRGMVLCTDIEWEVHGPHQDMNYQVFIGEAIYKNGNLRVVVAVYPHKVYEIISYDDWWRCRSEDVIPIYQG